MKPWGSYGLTSNHVSITPDDGYCEACEQHRNVVHLRFDTLSGGEVQTSLCKKCLQQIIYVCFAPDGALP